MVIPDGTYKEFAIGGLLTMILVTATPGTAVGISTDLSTGVIDRFRTLPMSPSTILAGRSLADLMALCLGASIVGLTGLLIGWRPETSLLQVAGGFALVLLFAYAFSWAMVCMGMAVTDPESAQALSFLLVFPIAFVSYALGSHQRHAGVAAHGRQLEPAELGVGRRPGTVREPEPGRPLGSMAPRARHPRGPRLVGAHPGDRGAHRGAAVPVPHRRLTTAFTPPNLPARGSRAPARAPRASSRQAGGRGVGQSRPGRPSMLTAFLAVR